MPAAAKKCAARARRRRKNAAELLIFNPSKPKKGIGNHKPGCPCSFCGHARDLAAGTAAPPRANRSRRATKKQAGSGVTTKKAKLRNPSDLDQAVLLYEGFSGQQAKKIVEKQESAAMRLDYAYLGELFALQVETPAGDGAEFNFSDDKVKLCMSPNGRQLYCIGGNQDLGGELSREELQKDFIDLGYCTRVVYFARKAHIDHRPVEYFHDFGEETGDLPRLVYDKIRKRIYFTGGNYMVKLGAGGLSPGIEN